MKKINYCRHRFPPEIIQHAVWPYFRFPLGYRDVEDLLAERGTDVSYETVRRWALKFGAACARELRRLRPRPDGRWHPVDSLAPDLSGEQGAEAVPPIPDRLMADVDPSFVQQVLDVPQREREPDMHHPRQADDLRRGFEIAKRAAFADPRTLESRANSFKRISSDNALQTKPVRRAAKVAAELGDGVNVRSLCRRRQIADRHVFDHAPP
jgi:hypothetical protein